MRASLKHSSGAAEAANTDLAAPGPAADPNPNRLLVLDDNEEFVNLVQRHGRALGFDTASAGNTPAFIAGYRKCKPSMVLLDVFLETDMCTSVIDFLAREGFKGPIIIVSGHDYRFLVSVAGIARQMGLKILETVEKGRNVDHIPALLMRGRLESASAAAVLVRE